MNVFDIRNNVVDHYAEYMKSFVRISDSDIEGYVEDHLTRGRLWPDPMVQLNPSFAPGGSIDDLVADGTLHPLSSDVFRYGKDEVNPRGHRQATSTKRSRMRRLETSWQCWTWHGQRGFRRV